MESTLIFLIPSLKDRCNPQFLEKLSLESSHAAHFLKYLRLSHSAFYGARSWPLRVIGHHEPTIMMLPSWSLCLSELLLCHCSFCLYCGTCVSESPYLHMLQTAGDTQLKEVVF